MNSGGAGGAEQTGMRSHWQLCPGVEDGASLVTGAESKNSTSRRKRGRGWANLVSVRTSAPETSSVMPHQPAAHCSRWLFYTLRDESILSPRGCERVTPASMLPAHYLLLEHPETVREERKACSTRRVQRTTGEALHRRRLRRDRCLLGQQLFLPVPKQNFIRIPLHIPIKDVDRILNSFLFDVQHRQTSIRFFQ